MKKSKVARLESLKTLQRLKEIEATVAAAEAEEKETLEFVQHSIDTLCTEHTLFCGVRLTHEDLINILSLALTTPETIEIPYKLYFTD